MTAPVTHTDLQSRWWSPCQNRVGLRESASERFVAGRLENYSDGREQLWIPLDPPVPEPVSCECNLNSRTVVATGDRLFIHVGSLASSLDKGCELDAATDQWRFAEHRYETQA